MITFKSYLVESRSAPLYHGTHVAALTGIMSKGLMPKTLHVNHKILTNKAKNGVSATRSFKFADNWAPGSSLGCVLELDQKALSQRYKIIPVQYFQTWPKNERPARIFDHTGYHNEYEEFIVTDKPIPSKYITRIYIRKDDKEYIDEKLNPIIQQYGSSFIRSM